MNDSSSELLFDTAARLFRDQFEPAALQAAEAGKWLGSQWQAIEELGLPSALLPEDAGGFGVEPIVALRLVRIAGAHAVPAPIAETMMAGWLLASAGLSVPVGPLSAAPGRADEVQSLRRRGAGWHLYGSARRVPWARHAVAVAVVTKAEGRPSVALLQKGQWTTTPGINLAGEPRDDVLFDAELTADAVAELPDGLGYDELRAFGAGIRSLAMAGALETVLAMTVAYANERSQFGRPIGKFQAIQQYLAVMAGQVAGALGAADIAAEAIAEGVRVLPIAAAKVRTGEAASISAAIAHQVHGAIGFTHEHSLHFFTKRLWSWRDEFGSEAEWSGLLGRQAIAAGGSGLWPMIAAL